MRYLYLFVWVRIYWVEAYLAHHRDDQFAFNYYESKMRACEKEIELIDFQRSVT